MSAKPRIRDCDLQAAKKAEEMFGRPVRAISRAGVTIHFDDPTRSAANDDDDPLTRFEKKHGYREAEGH